ncbi:MAG: hypothetical protein ABIP06_13145 [Pyrinomonadaceae bacterium]
MRLHTDFHDYYDNAVGYGIDENIFYSRFTKKVEILIKTPFDHAGVNGGLLGFCGTIYPFALFTRSENFEIVDRYFAYNLEEYKRKSEEWKYKSRFSVSRRFTEQYRKIESKRWQKREMEIKQFFIDWSSQSNEIFLEFKVPIWTVMLGINQSQGLINPRLKDYGFDRLKDSFTTFQEISMYLSNILVEQKEVAVIEDKYRIEQHGFDLKKSFRKEKKS